MYVEKRKERNSIKYYLVHSYREKGVVKKIRKYLGLDLSKEELERRKKETVEVIEEIVDEHKTEVFNFKLGPEQLKKLDKYDNYLKINHLVSLDWKQFTEDFVYNTNAIEGSTVQASEVHDLIEKNKLVENKDEQETLNVAKAVEFIRKTREELSLDLILKIHHICFEGTKSFAGKFRTVEVVIRNSKGEILHSGTRASELREALENFIVWYHKNKSKFKPLVLAAIVHNQFEHIHPFQDGNGRVGRLLLNLVLLQNNYPPINIKLEDRQEYYKMLQEYSNNRKLKPTLEFLIKEYKRMLKVPTKRKKG